MNDVAKKISKIMDIYGVSYGDISNATGIPKSAIHRYVTGETGKIPLDRLEAIGAYLNIGVPYLLGWDKSKDSDYVAEFHNKGYRYNQAAREDGHYTIDSYAEYILNNERKEKRASDGLDPYTDYQSYTDFDDNVSIYGDHNANLEHFADKPELLEIYKEIHNSESLQLLFDSAKDLTPEALESVLQIIKQIKSGNQR